jgi:iron complex transport system ATP-binding protein
VDQALAFRNVGFAYGRNPVFRDLDIEVEAGSMTAFLGPNGAGKTTLVRLGCAAARPGSGSIALFGSDLAELPARLRARLVAVVPQESEQTFDFTVGELVLLGRAPHLGLFGIETAHDREIAGEAMRSTEVEALAGRPFRALSGGEKQRVLLARALAQQPRLLLLDEPTAFLDLRHRLATYALLARLRRESGLTVVVVSHDLNLASRHCDRLVLLHRGAIAADGAPSDVLQPDTLRSVYEVEVEVHEDPASGRPFVIAIAPSPIPPGGTRA